MASKESDLDTKLIAQMLRDVCVEAVLSFEEMGRLEELKVNKEAEQLWLEVATEFRKALA